MFSLLFVVVRCHLAIFLFVVVAGVGNFCCFIFVVFGYFVVYIVVYIVFYIVVLLLTWVLLSLFLFLLALSLAFVFFVDCLLLLEISTSLLLTLSLAALLSCYRWRLLLFLLYSVVVSVFVVVSYCGFLFVVVCC